IETFKQNLSEQELLSSSLSNSQQDHQLSIERLTNEHQQIISDLKNEFSKQKSLSESEYFTIIHEKNEEIDNLHEQLLTQNSQIDSHQDTIEHLRKDLHDYEIKYSEQNAQLDQLLDQQKHISESMIRLKNVLNVDANDHDELLEQLLHKMEQSQLI
ncbi:unnamed protein product, partial [Adineta steineri]